LLAKSKSANQEIHENPLLWVLVLVPAVLLAKRIALAAHTLLFVLSRGKDRRCGRHQNRRFRACITWHAKLAHRLMALGLSFPRPGG